MAEISQNKSGVVQSLNVTPNVYYEGLLLETSEGVLQVNFPTEGSATVTEVAAPASIITVEIEPRETHGQPAHPVFELVRLINGETGKSSVEAGDDQFSGTVESLNYALHCEVNGAILHTGDFVQVKPHGAAALALSVGMNIKATGPVKPMVGGHRVI